MGYTRRRLTKQRHRETGNMGYTRRRLTKQRHRETGNMGYTRRRLTKQRHNLICLGQHYTQTNTNNVNNFVNRS